MSQSERELDELLAPLRDNPVALSGGAAAGSQRDRLLPGVRAQVGRVPSRMRRARVMRRSMATGCVLGAIALGAWGMDAVQRARQPVAERAEPLRIEPGSAAMAWIDASGARREIRGALTLEAPGELVGARDAWSHVSTARGVQLELAPRARLRVTAAPQITASATAANEPSAAGGTGDKGVGNRAGEARAGLRLLQGEVHCRVPKLGKEKQFSIATPDAQVIVHGTVFSVAVSDAALPTTCVRVDEGLVEVRSGGSRVFLGPEMQWGCDRDPSTEAAAASDARIAERKSVAAQAPSTPRRAMRGRSQTPLTPEGTLDVENRLLASALAAERDGELAQARKLFAQLLTHHPNSPLVPEARLGLARSR